MPLFEVVKNPAHWKEVSEFLGVREQPQTQPARTKIPQSIPAGPVSNILAL